MAGLIVVLLAKLVIEIGRIIGRLKGNTEPQPICMFAHIQYPSNGRLAISCMFGGGVHPMKLDVLYCTDYRNLEERFPGVCWVSPEKARVVSPRRPVAMSKRMIG